MRLAVVLAAMCGAVALLLVGPDPATASTGPDSFEIEVTSWERDDATGLITYDVDVEVGCVGDCT